MWSGPLSEAKPTGAFCIVAIRVNSRPASCRIVPRRRPPPPGFLLRLAVIVAGQFLDGGDEDRRQDGRIRRQALAAAQVLVTPVPSRQNTPNSLRTSTTAATITAHLMKM